MKRHNPDTGEVYDTDSVWIGHYQNAIEDKKYWKLPLYIKYQGRIFIIDINDDCYIDSCGICIPIHHIGWMMNNEEAEPFDINIDRIGKKENDLSLLEWCHKICAVQYEESKKYWSEETKKKYIGHSTYIYDKVGINKEKKEEVSEHFQQLHSLQHQVIELKLLIKNTLETISKLKVE